MSPSYRVIYPESVRSALRVLLAGATARGNGPSVRDALRVIDRELHNQPRALGDPKYRYRALKLELYVGIVPPLVVHYAVHEEQPLVIVKAVQALPGQGL